MKPGGPLRRFTRLASGEPPKRRSWIRQVSKKRQRENRERSQMVRELWPDGVRPRCVVPWCEDLADDLHEPKTRARGGSITDPDCGEPVCRGHNHEMTLEPAWGYELDLLVHSWDRRSLADIKAARRKALAAAELEIAEQGFLSAAWAGEVRWAR